MARDTIRLNDYTYRIFRGRDNARAWSVSSRPSQRGDPGGLGMAEWQVDGPNLFSIEDIAPGGEVGHLAVDYGIDTDSRWTKLNTLGPQINTLALGTYDPLRPVAPLGSFMRGYHSRGGSLSVQNADGQAEITPGGVQWAYITRGQAPAKVRVSDMTLYPTMAPGHEFPADATSVIATRTALATVRQELSVGLGDTPVYQVLQEAKVGTAGILDVWQDNDASQAARSFGQAPDRTVALSDISIDGNILSGSTTMLSPNWNNVGTIQDEPVRFTGFAMDGNLWVIGTARGPYILDGDTGDFFGPMQREVAYHVDNCRGMTTWFPLGIIMPFSDGVRWWKGLTSESWGLERFTGNASPVQGQPTGHAGTTRWLYQTVYNAETGHSWLIAWRPREVGDLHPHMLSPYVLARLDSVQSRYLSHVGTANGLRTNPTLMGGHGSDAFWMTIGRIAREIDDSNYRYATSGTTYLTEMRRFPGVIKDFEAVELESNDCTANRTVTLGFEVDGAAVQQLTGTSAYSGGATLNGVVNTDGFQRVLFVDDSGVPLSWASGRRIKPQWVFASDSTSTAPQVLGTLRLYFRWRPLMVNLYEFSVELDGSRGESVQNQEAQLLTEWGSGPLLVKTDVDFESYYVKVQSVNVREVRDTGGGEESPEGVVRVADVRAITWQTTA